MIRRSIFEPRISNLEYLHRAGGQVSTEGAESALRHVKPSVRGLGAYTLERLEPRIKLNQNESPYDVPPELKRSIQERLAGRAVEPLPALRRVRLHRGGGDRPPG